MPSHPSSWLPADWEQRKRWAMMNQKYEAGNTLRWLFFGLWERQKSLLPQYLLPFSLWVTSFQAWVLTSFTFVSGMLDCSPLSTVSFVSATASLRCWSIEGAWLSRMAEQGTEEPERQHLDRGCPGDPALCES